MLSVLHHGPCQPTDQVGEQSGGTSGTSGTLDGTYHCCTAGDLRGPRPSRHPRTRLIGHDTERSLDRSLVLDEAVPLLTLIDPGSVGKTQLGLALVDEAAGSFVSRTGEEPAHERQGRDSSQSIAELPFAWARGQDSDPTDTGASFSLARGATPSTTEYPAPLPYPMGWPPHMASPP